MIKSTIESGSGNGIKATVLDNGALLTQQADLLQVEAEKITIFNSFLTSDGSSSDAPIDMRANGATTPVLFYIAPQQNEKDLYISTVFFTIADAGASLNRFGNIAALTNGLDFFYESDLGVINIRTGLVSNFEVGRMCGFQPAFGSGNDAFRGTNVESTSEGYLFEYDFKRKNGFARGLYLRGGTNQRLVVQINDNITGIDKFDVYVSGFERIN